MAGVDNYSKIVLRTLHATPSTVVLRPSPSPYNSTNRWPTAAQVQSGVVFGEGQYYLQEYETGTLVGGGAVTTIHPFAG
ncbi:MAG: hypothetical protein FJ027_19275 [Candidatus Rokubacteria bacterium]|nr:hypothetical protein [Candidatus Rokubacteria bacterium]